jgi:hypothetical protein
MPFDQPPQPPDDDEPTRDKLLAAVLADPAFRAAVLVAVEAMLQRHGGAVA